MSENLDSRALRNTDCYGQRFMKPGTYTFHCTPHPFMKGVIVVR